MHVSGVTFYINIHGKYKQPRITHSAMMEKVSSASKKDRSSIYNSQNAVQTGKIHEVTFWILHHSVWFALSQHKIAGNRIQTAAWHNTSWQDLNQHREQNDLPLVQQWVGKIRKPNWHAIFFKGWAHWSPFAHPSWCLYLQVLALTSCFSMSTSPVSTHWNIPM